MKIGHPITIDRARTKSLRGGEWQGIDPISQGRVQVLPAGGDVMTQAVAVMAEFQRLSALAPAWEWTKCAVIAREWKYLDPVWSFCERNGIPVEMAGEDTAYFWRLRETQALVDWMHTQPLKLVNTACIEQWLEAQPQGPWWVLLREAVDVYGLETDGAELPTEHFLEWLVEWGREVRRRQTGLLLLTAHRAKGLEFDHVAVLDGAWGKASQNEDPDAPRRLYYVAMTRARKTLTLARFGQGHALLDAMEHDPSLLRRASTSLPPPAPELARCYRRLTLREVDLSFAGRYIAGNSVHRAIAALSPGDSLQLHQRQERWELQDSKGTTVGRLARVFTPPNGMSCVAARVMAIIVRRRDDAEPEYQSACRCEWWELVLPELVFEPSNHRSVGLT
jgi:ATP-dependent DNA helicase RecQ